MRSSWLVWGVLGWAVGCGDDGVGNVNDAFEAGLGNESSSLDAAASVTRDGGAGSSTNRGLSGTGSTNDEDTGGSQSHQSTTAPTSAGQATTADAGASASIGSSQGPGTSEPTCPNDCELDAVACEGEGQALAVLRCAVDESTGCKVWETIPDCTAGSCLPTHLVDGCDLADNAAKCSANGLVVCAIGASGCPVWQAPTAAMETMGDVEIDEGATSFTGYGMLELKLTSDVDEQIVACLTDTREVARVEDSPLVDDIETKGNGVYELALARYQLPVVYELEVAIGNPPAVRSTVMAPDVKSRVAFVSASQGNADFRTWPNATSDDPLAAADAVCTAEAQSAGLSGEFRAFLSVEAESGVRDATDALCRLRGGDGTLAEGCGLDNPLSEAQLSAPYLNLRGLPVAYGTADIEAGHWRLPVGYEASGVASGTGVASWTGSNVAGQFARSDCQGWTTNDAGERGNAAGNPGVTTPSDTYSLGCDEDNSLLCFSSGEGHALATSHERAGKVAFVVELAESSSVGLDTANQACEVAFGSEDVVAWFSDEEQDAYCRLAGLVGKVDEACGQLSAPDLSGPWVRADGYLIAEDLEELLSGPRAPINTGLSGAFVPSDDRLELVRTDTRANGGRGAVSVNVPCISGDRGSIESGWTYFTNSCDSVAAFRPFVYCFER